MIIYYIDVLPSGKVRGCIQFEIPNNIDNLQYQIMGEAIAVDAPVDWSGPTETSELHWINGAYAWVDAAPLDAQRQAKLTSMSQSCAGAILSGFVSSALGAVHTYPAKPNDQLNLIGSVAASFYPNVGADWVTPFWCADAAGAWAFRAHTAAQIQQVGVDGKNAILNCMTINERLAAQIMAAGPDQLAAIVWPA